jgi:hypothetical protein
MRLQGRIAIGGTGRLPGILGVARHLPDCKAVTARTPAGRSPAAVRRKTDQLQDPDYAGDGTDDVLMAWERT